MKTAKAAVTAFLALLLAFTLCACGGGAGELESGLAAGKSGSVQAGYEPAPEPVQEEPGPGGNDSAGTAQSDTPVAAADSVSSAPPAAEGGVSGGGAYVAFTPDSPGADAAAPGPEASALPEESAAPPSPAGVADQYKTDPVPEGRPLPVEPQSVTSTGAQYTCTLTVRCDTILSDITRLDPEKVELVPQDGIIFAAKTVTFNEGESVFRLLQRELKAAKIHMEFRSTPMYNSAYVLGINNIYEYDCGELSGWMYKVNDWFPNYGSTRYQLRPGDTVEWHYTCDLGRDLGEFSLGGK